MHVQKLDGFNYIVEKESCFYELTAVKTQLTQDCDGFYVVVVALLFYVHGKHLRSCRNGQLP